MPNPAVFLQFPWQSIPAVPNRRVSLQCSMAKLLCRQQPLQSIFAALNSRVSLSARPRSISAVPMAMYPCSAQTHSIFAVLSGQVSLWCPTLAMSAQWGAQHWQCRSPQMLTFADFANCNACNVLAPNPPGNITFLVQ